MIESSQALATVIPPFHHCPAGLRLAIFGLLRSLIADKFAEQGGETAW
jgi:hypothetical protein